MPKSPSRSIAVGAYGRWPLTRLLGFPPDALCEHTHVIGLSKSGKSRWLVSYYLALLEHGCPVTLLDPHGTTAQLVLSHLVARGFFRRKDAFHRVRFLDFPAADQQGRYLPFNVLSSHGSSHVVAANVLEAFHRAWPKLADGDAPRFDKLVLNGVKVLQSNGLPLPLLTTFLTNRDFRTRLLANEPDPAVVAVWRDWYDRLTEKLRLDYSDSTLTRLNLITFNPVLKYSLGQVENAVPLRQLMDQGVSLIVNLALLDEDTRRLLSCLLTVGFEQAALSRGELDEGQLEQLPSHHLMVDEFGSTASTSGVAFGHMLSQTRKFRLYAVLAHQDWEQTPKALQGAIGNCGIEVVFKVNRDDAEYLAKRIGRVDTGKVKHVVASGDAQDRTHPVFDPLAEQWERQTQAIQDLKRRHALFRDASDRVWPIHTLDVATNPGDPGEVAEVKARFLAEHFRSQHDVEAKLREFIPKTVSQVRRNGPVRAEIVEDSD